MTIVAPQWGQGTGAIPVLFFSLSRNGISGLIRMEWDPPRRARLCSDR